MCRFKSNDRIQAWVVLGTVVLVAVAAVYIAYEIASRQTAFAVVLVAGMFLVTSWSFARMRRQREEHLRYHTLHDPLTGLPNRSLLVERLEGALLRAVRKSGSNALLVVDLDDFEEIGHGLGHDTGDELLKIVARRLVPRRPRTR
jgi:PleD family two-component response regulator